MATGTSKQIAVSPIIEYIDTESAFLQPVIIKVCFSGPIPRRLVPQGKPIKIDISLDESYHTLTSPIISASCWSEYEPAQGDLDTIPMVDDTPSAVSIPFLPLRPDFDVLDVHHWKALSKQIEHWLVTEVDITTPEWGWGCDAFWLAFIAACPSFPSGGWSPWDTRIPVNGQFITEWLNDDIDFGRCDLCEDSSGCPDNEPSIMFFIWGMFCKHVTLFYPLPLLE